MDYAANQVMAAGYSVIYDCNANRFLDRQEKSDIARRNGGFMVVVRIQVPYEISLERVQAREDSHDQRKFSLEKARSVVGRIVSEIEEPTSSENVILIDGQACFEDQYAEFAARLKDFRETIAAR